MSATAVRGQTQMYLRASYSRHYRRIVPELLKALEFRSLNTAHRPVLDGIDLVRRYIGRTERLFPLDEHVPLDDVVPKAWHTLVTVTDPDGNERINRINYEICVLQALRERLRCKKIWVHGARRWRNPDEDLPASFDHQRPLYYAALRKPMDSSEFIDTLRTEMTSGLDRLNSFVDQGGDGQVGISDRRNGWIRVAPLEAQPEAENLTAIRNVLNDRWPATPLLGPQSC